MQKNRFSWLVDFLTNTPLNDYAFPASAKSEVGFGHSINKGAYAMRRQVHSFFYAYSFMVGVMGG